MPDWTEIEAITIKRMSISNEPAIDDFPTTTERHEAAISARQADPRGRARIIQQFEKKYSGVDLLALLDAVVQGA